MPYLPKWTQNAKLFWKSDNTSLKASWRLALWYEIFSIFLQRAKQMRKIMCNWALFILHKKCQTLTFSRHHRKKKCLIHTQKCRPSWSLFLFTWNLKILVLSYSTWTDRPEIIIAVCRGRKTTQQRQLERQPNNGDVSSNSNPNFISRKSFSF